MYVPETSSDSYYVYCSDGGLLGLYNHQESNLFINIRFFCRYCSQSFVVLKSLGVYFTLLLFSDVFILNIIRWLGVGRTACSVMLADEWPRGVRLGHIPGGGFRPVAIADRLHFSDPNRSASCVRRHTYKLVIRLPYMLVTQSVVC